ncbi:integrase core domain-containing protein [Hoeflea sp.]|uniref:integrase core domain-containing protein n=1 Tax=Hoeflea sp. TaxID=1940281 RepID=UPI0019C477F7|nr:integrase core domain-containing protein [Hoeflea sp.]MBC7284682.1 transposase [Hoeflea sp.]
MDQRVSFISACLAGEMSMTELCALYSISRVTGYKWLLRYRQEGAAGLADGSSAPHAHGRQTAAAIVEALLSLRRQRPNWGPKKLVAYLSAKQPDTPWPAPSTAGEILKRAGLVSARRKRRRAPVTGFELTEPLYPNHVWAADHKGWVATAYAARLEPLTVTDGFSRYLVSLSATGTTRASEAHPLFRQAFEDHGLPEVIRTDNGSPFASASVTGLTSLSAHWTRLGIRHERIAPGKPQQNGRHERFHLTLKEAMTPPEKSQAEQQRRFDLYRQDYNEERPHEALGQQVPGRFFHKSQRVMPARIPEPDYPAEAKVRRVRSNGEIKWKGSLVFISTAIRADSVALVEIDNDVFEVRFYDRPIGQIDPSSVKLKPTPKHQPQKGQFQTKL